MTPSGAAITAALLLLATSGMAQTGPTPYAVTEINDGGVPACSLRGPVGSAWQLEFVQHPDDRLFLSLISPTWRLGTDSHGNVTVRIGSVAMTKEFRSVSPTRMTTELDWDRGSDASFIQSVAGSAVVDVSFPSRNLIHIAGPDKGSADTLDRCASGQKAAATPTTTPTELVAPAR